MMIVAREKEGHFEGRKGYFPSLVATACYYILDFSFANSFFSLREIEHLFSLQGVSMEYQLVFAPSLEIAPADFVTAWNEDGSTQDVAQAQIVSSTTKVYNGALLDAVLLVVNAVVLPLGTNALYDLIKGIVVKQQKHKHIKLTQLDQPDGTHLLVIEEEE